MSSIATKIQDQIQCVDIALSAMEEYSPDPANRPALACQVKSIMGQQSRTLHLLKDMYAELKREIDQAGRVR